MRGRHRRTGTKAAERRSNELQQLGGLLDKESQIVPGALPGKAPVYPAGHVLQRGLDQNKKTGKGPKGPNSYAYPTQFVPRTRPASPWPRCWNSIRRHNHWNTHCWGTGPDAAQPPPTPKSLVQEQALRCASHQGAAEVLQAEHCSGRARTSPDLHRKNKNNKNTGRHM